MRKNICLNGLWDFAPGDEKAFSIPQNWEAEKICVPSPWNINSFVSNTVENFHGEQLDLRGGEFDFFPEYPKSWENAKIGWYKTEFELPEEYRGSAIFLRFDAVHYESEFYLNGRFVHRDRDGFLPIEFRIDDVVRYGCRNTLAVCVKKAELFYQQTETGRRKVDFPVGSFWGMTIAGIWQDVFLEARPLRYLEDVFVHTDLEKETLTVETRLSGDFKGSRELEYLLRDAQGGAAYSLGTVPCSSDKTVFVFDYSAMRNRIKYWWPDSPKLYYIDVIYKENRQEADRKSTRFGFRSFKAIGKKFYLNGIPYNLRCDSWHYMGFAYQTEEYARAWYKMEKDAHVNCVRLHAQVYPEFFVSIADEMGMLIIDETAVWGSHCMFHYSTQFIENCKLHIERLVKRDRNHPSVIIWSVENECVPAYRVSADNAVRDEDELTARLFELSEHCKKFDPYRITSADGCDDYHGRMEILSLHYPGRDGPVSDKPVTIGEMGSLYYATPAQASKEYGEKAYLSFNGRLEAISHELFEMLKCQRKWAAQVCVFNLVWYGLVPLPFHERILHYAEYSRPGIKPTKIGPYISTLNSFHDKDLPEYVPNYIFRIVKEAYRPERFFFEESRTRFYCGSVCEKKISVHNDSLLEKEYEIECFVEKEGKVCSSTCQNVKVGPSEYQAVSLSPSFPDADRIGKFSLHVQMCWQGQVVFEDSQAVRIYNRGTLLKELRGRILFAGLEDPSLSQQLCAMGFRKLTETSALNDADVVLQCGKIPAGLQNKLDGSSIPVLYLSPTESEYATLMAHLKVKQGFACLRDSVLFKDLADSDFSEWPAGLAESIMDSLPGNSARLIASGDGQPLVTELYRHGRSVLCCLRLLENLDTEPAALLLLSNLISYLSSPASTFHNCVVVTKPDSALADFLKGIHLSFRLIDADSVGEIMSLRSAHLLIADGAYPLDYLDHLLPSQVDSLLVWGVKDNFLPKSLQGRLKPTDRNVYHLVKADLGSTEMNGLLGSDLYGLEPGNETVLTGHPLFIRDSDGITGLLRTPDLDWRVWNFRPEEKKTVAILRSEQENKVPLFALCSMDLHTIPCYLCQLNCDSSNRQLGRIASILLHNLRCRVDYHEPDEIDDGIKNGIYKARLTKALFIPADGQPEPSKAIPALNAPGKNAFWHITGLEPGSALSQGRFLYGFYLYSKSDRTDLLRNPDLVHIRVSSPFEKELYVNGRLCGKGSEIFVKAIPLQAGWNTIVFSENRNRDSAEPPLVVLGQKENSVPDLDFSLDRERLRAIESSGLRFEANDNAAQCPEAAKGKGYAWVTGATQHKGMYFRADLGRPYSLSKIQFCCRMPDDHSAVYTPQHFIVQASDDATNWETVFTCPDSKDLMLVNGHLILNFKPVRAKLIQVTLQDVALKPFVISELKLFSL